MNAWPTEQYNMMPMNPGMMLGQMPPLVPPLLPPPEAMMHMVGRQEWHQNQGPMPGPGNNFIGPIPPENQDTTMDLTQEDEVNEQGVGGSGNQAPRSRQSGNQGGSNNRESRWNRNRDRDSKGKVIINSCPSQKLF